MGYSYAHQRHSLWLETNCAPFFERRAAFVEDYLGKRGFIAASRLVRLVSPTHLYAFYWDIATIKNRPNKHNNDIPGRSDIRKGEFNYIDMIYVVYN